MSCPKKGYLYRAYLCVCPMWINKWVTNVVMCLCIVMWINWGVWLTFSALVCPKMNAVYSWIWLTFTYFESLSKTFTNFKSIWPSEWLKMCESESMWTIQTHSFWVKQTTQKVSQRDPVFSPSVLSQRSRPMTTDAGRIHFALTDMLRIK